MKFQSEEAFMRSVIDLARIAGWKVHHDRADMRQHTEGDAGFPDLVLAKHGRVIFAELKAPKGILAPAQREWLNALSWMQQLSSQPTTHKVLLWRPADWDAIVETLTGRKPGGVL